MKFDKIKARILRKPKQLNETLATIYERRAVRKYKEKPVSRDLIEQVLAAGWMAPSAMNMQPWKFYVVTNKELISIFSKEISKWIFKNSGKIGVDGIIKMVSELFHFAEKFGFSILRDPVFHGAPVVIFVTSHRNNEWAPLDIGMCTQNMMLAAKSLGLDTCPVGFGKFVEHAGHYFLLNIPGTEIVQLAIIVGYGDETPPVHERKTDNITFIK